MEVTLQRNGAAWSAQLRAAANHEDALRQWARQLGASNSQGDRALVRTGRLTLALPKLPTVLLVLDALGSVPTLRLHRDGSATVSLLAPEPAQRAALQLLGGEEAAGSVPAQLTPRQAELLHHCVERGYYDIPRRATLRALGKEIGITATSLSLALRRAEAKIITAYARSTEKEILVVAPKA